MALSVWLGLRVEELGYEVRRSVRVRGVSVGTSDCEVFGDWNCLCLFSTYVRHSSP